MGGDSRGVTTRLRRPIRVNEIANNPFEPRQLSPYGGNYLQIDRATTVKHNLRYFLSFAIAA